MATHFFITAIHRRYLNIVNYLLEHGADAKLANTNGNTPLIFAAQNNLLDFATSLLKHGANANETDAQGGTPLFMATQKGSIEIV